MSPKPPNEIWRTPTAGRGLDLLCHLHHFLVVEVQAGDGVVGLGMLGLFLHAEHLAVLVELHDAKALGVLHIVAEHGAAALVLCVGHGALEQLGEAVAVENVITQDHGAAVVANELLAQNKGLCQTIRRGLHLILPGTFVAVVMALTAFAVSNLSFANGSEANMNMFYIRTLVDLAGVLILTVQHEQLREAALHSELAELDGVLHRQYEQYNQSKENIRLINRRYHELKMQIAAIRAERDHAKQDVALAAMESGIRQYEAENKTGNPVLDTLLTAKSLYCQQHHITMTCVADGHLLDFLETGEICTIVGTALDNATESVETEPDHEKRLIRVAVYAQNGFVMLRFENYCAQEVELGADGLPRRNTHGGSDLRGVRAAAEKRGGTMTLHWENEWFTLRVLLPQKS